MTYPSPNQNKHVEDELITAVGSFAKDPLGFVMFAFPWGEVGTDLEHESGPDLWQIGILESLGSGLINLEEAIQLAVASGHGIGKSALVSWIILWAMSTMEDTKGVVTANTETQLKTKTWAELAKWFRMLICKHWFHMTATVLYSVDPAHEKTWRFDMVPWSEKNTEAFAGLHNSGKRAVLIFDEASAIPDAIWEVSEGFTTDRNTENIWIAFGNPTKNTGRFKECFEFGRFAHRWENRQIDSRTAKMANVARIQEWVDDYGEDSDFVRVRVRGVFPRAGTQQLIPQDLVQAARKNYLEFNKHVPKILTLDVARFGDNKTVPCLRQGRKATILAKWSGFDTVRTTTEFIKLIELHKPDAIVVDEDGIGGAVVDNLRAQKYDRWRNKEILYGFRGGLAAFDDKKYFNRRSEVWVKMRDWLDKQKPDIDDKLDLEAELIGPEYGLDSKGRFQLESKDHMKDRGLESPDQGDALAMSFAVDINVRWRIDEDDEEQKAMEDYAMVSNGGISWMR